jgi:Undecaprenyl-phosphate glucose phosphotransferase
MGYTIFFLNSIHSYFIAKNFLFYSLAVFGLNLAIGRLLLAYFCNLFSIKGPTKTAIVVGKGANATELYKMYNSNSTKGYKIAGLFYDEPSGISNEPYYLGNINLCIEYAVEHKIDEIICTLPASQHEKIEELIKESDRNLIRFKLVPEYFNHLKGTLFVDSISNLQTLAIRIEPLENIFSRAHKRMFDIVFSLCVIVFIFTWLFPIIYLLIKLESVGPAFYVQWRSGRDNRPFKCIKFRSMYVDNEDETKQASRQDPRITKIGAFLRKTSLDELPQFFNVLFGNMSIVGPRPHMLNHTIQYSELIDQFMVRHFIKPGITGWAQINGLRGETKTVNEMFNRVEADVWYIENWSFILDVKIIFFTAYRIIFPDKNTF